MYANIDVRASVEVPKKLQLDFNHHQQDDVYQNIVEKEEVDKDVSWLTVLLDENKIGNIRGAIYN